MNKLFSEVMELDSDGIINWTGAQQQTPLTFIHTGYEDHICFVLFYMETNIAMAYSFKVHTGFNKKTINFSVSHQQ